MFTRIPFALTKAFTRTFARTFAGTAACAFIGLGLVPPNTLAAEGANKAEATAMVRKGVAYIKAQGPAQGYAEISRKAGPFIDRDLYLVVYGLDGLVRAHGANARLVGKNLIDLKDIDGKAFVRERVGLARDQAAFWHDYKFTNPVTKKVQPKQMYCERLDDSVVCGGIYKD